MINIEDIININYNYDNMNLINPFNSDYTFITFDNPFYLKFYLNCQDDFHIISIKMTISKYIEFLEKITNKNGNLCGLCKCITKSWCGYCQEFFCASCFEIHLKKCGINTKMISQKFEINNEKLIKEFYDNGYDKQINKLNSIDNIPKNWKTCFCKKNEAIYCCEHGLRCKNCLKCGCSNDFEAENFRFFHLDVLFLKKESEGFDVIKSIENEVKLFNENVAQIYLEYKEEIEKIKNESRKKRIMKHFTDIRKEFISYQKLKLIVINVLRKEQNINLLEIFNHFINYKLKFNKFIYSKELSLDKNLSKLSNFLATQKPIIFSQKEEKENINLIDKYLELEKKESKNEKYLLNLNNLKFHLYYHIHI